MIENAVTNAELQFRIKFRDQWAAWLQTEMGRTFISAIYSHRPVAIPSQYPSQDSHRLGQVMNFDLIMKLIAVDLIAPIQVQEEIKQDYPDDESVVAVPPKTQEPK